MSDFVTKAALRSALPDLKEIRYFDTPTMFEGLISRLWALTEEPEADKSADKDDRIRQLEAELEAANNRYEQDLNATLGKLKATERELMTSGRNLEEAQHRAERERQRAERERQTSTELAEKLAAALEKGGVVNNQKITEYEPGWTYFDGEVCDAEGKKFWPLCRGFFPNFEAARPEERSVGPISGFRQLYRLRVIVQILESEKTL